MTIKVRRTIFRHGGSYVVAIPKEWFNYYDLGPGDKVDVIAGDNEVKILPVEKQDEHTEAE